MSKPSFGEKAADALFALVDKAKLSGKPGALAREALRVEMAALLNEMVRKHREPKPKRAPSEDMGEILIAEFSQKAAYEGVNVRAEYGFCMEWCVRNRCLLTPKRFTNWMNNQARDALKKAPGGEKLKQLVAKSLDLQTEPFGWRMTLARIHPSIDKAELAGLNTLFVQVRVEGKDIFAPFGVMVKP